LCYDLPEAELFCNEVTVEKNVPRSYFMACGFKGGYFGIKDRSSGEKIVLFSVWDGPNGNGPDAAPEENRAELLHKDEGVVVTRVEDGGTASRSEFSYDWKVGEVYRFAVKATASGEKTAFAAYFYLPESEAWKHLATFRRPAGGRRLEGLESFIEDIRGSDTSATEVRRAVFGNGWVRTPEGRWEALLKARFSAPPPKRKAKETIDAGVVGEHFYLQTGGNTRMTTHLQTVLVRPLGAAVPPEIPED
jgi:hypothetical protein